MDKKEIRAEMERLISAQLHIGKDEVKPNATLDDLGADSLDLVELALAAEEIFDIEIPDDDLWNGKIGTMTVEDAVDYIKRRRRE